MDWYIQVMFNIQDNEADFVQTVTEVLHLNHIKHKIYSFLDT